MPRWDDGYVTDVAYTTSFFREITPGWIGMSALVLGYRPPDLAAPFRYADLGCGNGFTALAIAASHPQAEVWGFDFNPVHIEFATNLAAAAGLGNAHFVETSFEELAAMPAAALPAFDFMVAHGVLSWISPPNRRHLVHALGQRLKPGGLVYLGYNVTTGWSAMMPVRTLMHLLAEASPERSDAATPAVLDFVDRVRQAGALFFQVHPSLEMRLQNLRKHDPRYVAHEYLNQDWHPLMFAEVAAEMAEAKCRYIGSATFADNIDNASVPANLVPILAEQRDPLVRETLRDLGGAQSFRRDLYRKGAAPLPRPAQEALLDTLVLAGLGQEMPEGGPSFPTSWGSITGRPEFYRPLFAMLAAGPVSFQEARGSAAFADKPIVELIHAFALLVASGYAHPVLPGGSGRDTMDRVRRFNEAIADANRKGGDLSHLVAPAIGSALDSHLMEIFLVAELQAGKPADAAALTSDVLEILGRSGRSMQENGQPVTDPTEALRIARGVVDEILQRRLPLFQRL
ncbi:MAG: class I SAM-dependent methyltransferase, partial [Alphaproteobacteria bacterium]|nr:class I SAM-dependent methyltransferase [Alphaproteobacteria bacterium]